MNLSDILAKCDHTLLAQTATWAEIKAICDDGMKYQTASVCIPASFVQQAKQYVGDKLAICTVIGFPNGYNLPEVKAFEAKKAVETLHEEGIKVGLYNCMTIKPIDSEAIRKIGLEYDIVITVEEHNLIGGLGGAVAEELAEMKGHRAKLIRIGLNDIYPSIVGSQKFLREIYQMSEKYILKRIREVIADEKSCGNRSY